MSKRFEIIYAAVQQLMRNAAATQGVNAVYSDQQGFFLAQELEEMEANAYMVEFPELKMRKIFPVLKVNPGKNISSYKAYETKGSVKWLNGTAKDLPRVGVGAKKVSAPLEPFGTTVAYDYFDLLAAAAGDDKLDDMLMVAARQESETHIDNTILNGAADVNITGWLDNPDIPTSNVPNGTSGFPDWANKTAQEIASDINSVNSETVVDTLEVEECTKLALPTDRFLYLQETIVSGTDSSLLTYMVKNTWVKSVENFVTLPAFATAGAGSTAIMIGFNPEPTKVQYILGMDTTFLPVQVDILEYITPVVAKCGGLRIRKPKSMRRKEGI